MNTNIKVDAYFTVEAALVLPAVFGVIITVIYLLFFEYDRCLMEQDIGALALYGASVAAADNDERIHLLSARAGEIYEQKYLAWNGLEIGMRLEKGKLTVKRKGVLRFPFSNLGFGQGDFWEMSVSYKNEIRSPVSMIRNFRKLTGGN